MSNAYGTRSGTFSVASIDGRAAVNTPSSFGARVDAMDFRALKQWVRNSTFSQANNLIVDVTILLMVAVIS